MSKELLKKLSFSIGGVAIFVAGLIFAVMGDLSVKSSSFWLIGGILLTFGSGVCVVLGDIFKEKPTVMWVMKGVALGLAVAYIGFMVGFNISTANANSTKPEILTANTVLLVLTLVFTVIAIAAQTLDVVLTATVKEE